MSTHRPRQETLVESVDRAVQMSRERAQARLEDAGAQYGRPDPERDTDAESGVCRRCGRDLKADDDVTDDALRVVGDNDGCLPVCDECWVTPQYKSYETAVLAVNHYRRGRGMPDESEVGE